MSAIDWFLEYISNRDLCCWCQIFGIRMRTFLSILKVSNHEGKRMSPLVMPKTYETLGKAHQAWKFSHKEA